jgi:pseudaminic acid cytidylyltransferase
MTTIAIIPARGGSKRIPRKNVKPFCGKPLIQWAIDAAAASRLFDRIVVSTDDTEVASLSRNCGAETPFIRPAQLSDDHATTDAVVLHATNELRSAAMFSIGCCIYPNPFVIPSDLQAGHELLSRERATSAFPVVHYDFPIEHAMVLHGTRARPRWPDMLDARSQDLTDHVHDAGLFYWFDVVKFVAAGKLLGDDAVGFLIPSLRTQDLNTLDDWARAEQKFKLLAAAEQW